ncbi:MAG: radical SAM protein, partial [Desulfobacteraceae bacterium]|nr:radical SAM protein [Desulfobacteraceae bacterium]
MIGISKLYCDTVEPSDTLRYSRLSNQLPSHLLQFSKDKKPVVVWNMTRRCNLKCVHCYAQSEDKDYNNELSHEESLKMIDDLAEFGVPVLLFSGGEPLIHPRLVEYAEYAVKKGMRAVISTNGTLITKEKAEILKKIGLSYVGISIDGLEDTHNKFRGVNNAYKKAMEAVKHCQAAGIKVGLRFTINKRNVDDIPGMFDILDKMNIPRACFYHLVYSGRGS